MIPFVSDGEKFESNKISTGQRNQQTGWNRDRKKRMTNEKGLNKRLTKWIEQLSLLHCHKIYIKGSFSIDKLTMPLNYG